MLEVSRNFIKKIENCQWFSNCGTKEIVGIDFDVKFLTQKQALKSVNSMKWENFCLDRRGELTVYLNSNYREVYSQWNSITDKIKDEYMNDLCEEWWNILNDKGIIDALDDVKFNVLALFMTDCYSKYYYSKFYDKMLKVYLAGHLPCGWEGTPESGRMLIY